MTKQTKPKQATKRTARASRGSELTPFDVGYPSDVPLAGRWVAWDQRRRKILAVSENFMDVIQALEAAKKQDDPDVVVDVAPGLTPEALARRSQILPDESPDVVEDVRKMFGSDADRWLDTPHLYLAMQSPRSLAGTDQEYLLRWLLRQMRSGIPS